MDWPSIVLGTWGALGTIISFISFIQYHKEKRKNKSIKWDDLQIAITHMYKKIKEEFVPDILFIPNEKGGVLANLIKKNLKLCTPCIFGIGVSKKYTKYKINNNLIDDYYIFETTKWIAYLPKILKKYKDKKLLVIDDFVMTGDFAFELKKKLVHDIGFDESNIKIMSLATTQIAIDSQKGPDYYWKSFDSSKVYLPWGIPE